MKLSFFTLTFLTFILQDALAQNNKPTLSGPLQYEVHAGQQICFSIYTNDQDPGDSTFTYWMKDIPVAQWSDNNGTVKHAKGDFCWTPSDDDASTLPYRLRVCVTDKKDTTCAEFTISILPTARATRSFVNKGNGIWELTITPTSSFFTGATLKWYVPKPAGTGSPTTLLSQQASVIYKFTTADKYLVKSSIFWKGDYNTYFDTIPVDSSFFPTGIYQNNISAKITYLNDNRIKVEIPGNIHARIFDINGKEQILDEGDDELLFDLSSMSSGMYILQLEQGNLSGRYKILRQ